MPETVRVTLLDIARAVGVAKSTVARALANDPAISAATRERVTAKAQEMGYRPDPGLSALSALRWQRNGTSVSTTIACISSNSPRHNDSMHEYRAALHARAAELGYRFENFEVADYGSGRRLSDVLYHRGIRSLVVLPVVVAEPALDLTWKRFVAVACGVGEYRLPIHAVDVNHFSAVRLAFNACRMRGYTRIGGALFRQAGPDHNDALRHAAFLYEQGQLPPGHARLPILESSMFDQTMLREWLRAHRPDAVISLNEGFYWRTRDAGHVIPEEMGFCVLSKTFQARSPISGAILQHSLVAKAAINRLDQMTRHHEFGLPATPDDTLIDPVWFEGTTLRPLATQQPAGKSAVPPRPSRFQPV